jgi:inhibitor of cysteine peptidase
MQGKTMVRAALLMMGILVIVLLVSNCGPEPEAAKTVGLTEQGGGCGSSVGLNAGDTLELVLDGNPTTGYIWEIGFVVPSEIKPVGDPEFKADSQRLGAGGSYTFRFQAVAEGQATLKLIYHRPFESQTAPLKTCEVTVVVR